jgi:catechol 2,3-dioxygenase-like lactoylglutathione lyase family enzyme
MMKTLFFSLFALTAFAGFSQDISFRIDHYSMVVKDPGITGDFYAEILGLEEIPHPDKAEGFRWFSIDGVSQLHLIKKDTLPVGKSKSEHLCLSTSSLDGLMDFLEGAKVPYWDWQGRANAVTLRTDGVRQIYLQDPEGNWIEVNDAGR